MLGPVVLRPGVPAEDVEVHRAPLLHRLIVAQDALHFGLIPRMHRGIFAMNEIPELDELVQVGLFNIMQEGDVQIKGFPVRLPLDVMLVFTANPEDYTARGKIVTPLKDRIGSEIKTHYPATLDDGVAITEQEAWLMAERLLNAIQLATVTATLERLRGHPEWIGDAVEELLPKLETAIEQMHAA